MPLLALPSDAFCLGDVIVVPSLNRLVRGDDWEDIEPRVMRVLAVLARTPGEVVTRSELFEAVWSGTVVNDEALTRAVSELRKALGDAAGAIETIRGTGYRLAFPIAPASAPDAPEASGERASGPASTAGPRPRAARGGSLVVLALALAGLSLLVALWAAWPRATPEAGLKAEEPILLDSTSAYYRPGMSELGVYYDSTTGAYFKFVEGDE